jgi:hypothetical protein
VWLQGSAPLIVAVWWTGEALAGHAGAVRWLLRFIRPSSAQFTEFNKFIVRFATVMAGIGVLLMLAMLHTARMRRQQIKHGNIYNIVSYSVKAMFTAPSSGLPHENERHAKPRQCSR